jgi:hypothetical protein
MPTNGDMERFQRELRRLADRQTAMTRELAIQFKRIAATQSTLLVSGETLN